MIELTKYNVTDDNSSHIAISGDNQKGIAIVFPLSTSKSEIELLDTIISKAIECDTDQDVLKVSLKSGSKIRWFQLVNTYRITNVLCFGINPRSLSLNFDFRYNELINFHNIEYIFSNSLEEIAQDQNLKKTLWKCIKGSTLT